MLTGLGVKIVQLVTDDPDAARCPQCRVRFDLGQGLGADPAAGPAVWRGVRGAVAQAALAVSHRALSAASFTEQVAQVPAGMRTTTRLRMALAVAVEDGRDQSEVAAAQGTASGATRRWSCRAVG